MAPEFTVSENQLNVKSDYHDNSASKGSFLNGRFVLTSSIRQSTSQFIVCTLGILKHLKHAPTKKIQGISGVQQKWTKMENTLVEQMNGDIVLMAVMIRNQLKYKVQLIKE